MMKKFRLLLLLFVVSCTNIDDVLVDESFINKVNVDLFARSQIALSKDSAQRVLENMYNEIDAFIYSLDSIVVAGDTLRGTRGCTIISQPYDSWLFIVDRYPYAAWSHECEYVYFNVENGGVEVVTEMNLPLGKSLSLIKSYQSQTALKKQLYDPSPQQNARNVNAQTKKYAVIIQGGTSLYENNYCFWNDCANLYRVLKSKYDFYDEDIYVLMSDGTNPNADRNLMNGLYDSSPLDLDDDGDADIDYSATYSNVANVFTELSREVNSGDELFIFVSGHGYCNIHNGQPVYYLGLWNEDDMSPSEFKSQLDKVTQYCSTNIVMNQCYSGAFVSSLRSRANTTISTACSEYEVSQARMSIGYFEFPYHWVAAINGKYPDDVPANADFDGDSNVSFLEAFKFAEKNNFFTTTGTINGQSYQIQTPQFACSSFLRGYNHGLSGLLFNLPTLTGPNYFVEGVQNTYSLSNVSDSANVTWSFSNILMDKGRIGNSIILSRETPPNQLELDLFVKATIQIQSLDLSFDLTKNNLVLWKGGICMSNDYIYGDLVDGEGYVSLPYDLPGAYGYTWYTSSSCYPEYQGLSHTNFLKYSRADIESEYDVWVEMYSPSGELVTIVRHYVEY